MNNNVVSRENGKEYLAQFSGNTIEVYKLDNDGKSLKASFDNIYVFANHYALIECEQPPLISNRVKEVIKTWIRLHESQKILYVSFIDYTDFADIVIKTKDFCYSVEIAKGNINFAKIDSDVNYTLESLGIMI